MIPVTTLMLMKIQVEVIYRPEESRIHGQSCLRQVRQGGVIRSGPFTGRPILHWDPAVSPGLRFMQIPQPRGLRMYRSKTYSPRRQSVVMVLLKGVSNVMTGIISPVMDAAQPVSSNSVAMESSRPD